MSDLAESRREILEAELIESVAERYLAAHLAAQRVAMVVLAAHAPAPESSSAPAPTTVDAPAHASALSDAPAPANMPAPPTVHASAGRRVPTGAADPWRLLARVAPECGEWADYFAATRPKCLAVAAGAHGIVTGREADDLVRDAATFHDVAVRHLRAHVTVGPGSAGRLRARGS